MSNSAPATTNPRVPAASTPGVPGAWQLVSVGFPTLSRHLNYLQPHRLAVFGALVAITVLMAGNLLSPLCIRIAIDEGIGHRDAHALFLAIAALLVIGLARGGFGFLYVYLAERTSQAIAYQLRDDLFAKMQKLSFSYYDQTETGQLLTRLTNDVDQVRSFFGTGALQIVQSVVMVVFSVAALLWLEWKLAIVAVLTLVPISVAMARFSRQIRPIFIQLQRHLSQMNTILRETLAGVRIVRAFGRQRHEAARYGEVNQLLLDQTLVTSKMGSNTFPLIGLCANFSTLAIVGLGGWQVMHGTLTLGTLLAFTSYMGFLIQPIMMLGFSMMMISRATVSAGRINELFDAPLDVADAPGAQVLPSIAGEIRFENVSFRYPGSERDVLTGVSFVARAGETVAIVGMTGSGKSSLAHLLPRFYDATGGQVLLDGHDVRAVTLSSLRSQLGIVLQEPLLFGGTIRDNIRYGRTEASASEVEAAARAAMAHGFIADMPDGYDTVIGERGVGLSGGQRQRIAIARVLLVNPHVIIFDDSTSAVDAETEAAIHQSVERLMRESSRTCLVIAHRFSTVRDADRIVVLDGGKLVAQGTHDELMRSSPVYQDILGTQFSAAEVAAP